MIPSNHGDNYAWKCIIINPIGEIDNEVHAGCYVGALIYSVICFEYLALKKLRSRGIRNQQMRVRAMTETLFQHTIIDQTTYNYMIEVIEERNRLVHAHRDMGRMYTISANSWGTLFEKAKHCIQELMR